MLRQGALRHGCPPHDLGHGPMVPPSMNSALVELAWVSTLLRLILDAQRTTRRIHGALFQSM